MADLSTPVNIASPSNSAYRLEIDSSGAAKTSAVAAAGYVALSSPPTQTGVGTDTTFTFSQQVNNVIIQNNSTVNVNVSFDSTATAGSILLTPGQYYEKAKKVTAVHLLTSSAVNVNGSSANNIVLLGEL
jgi:hypothetical protein